jgi:hypothetical protein
MKNLISLGLVAAFALGCDDANVTGNLDTFACMYLPSVVECTPEIKAKVASVLENGVVEAQIDC